MINREKIVTFCCQKSVFIFPKNSGHTPVLPCKFHSSVEAAKIELEKRGILNPEVKIVE